MKRILLVAILVILLSSCGRPQEETTTSSPTDVPSPSSAAEMLSWQDKYDLGLRFLSEGNYKEAIIAFTAAIEIDPKRAEAYVVRGEAYLLMSGSDDYFALALEDYKKAFELDDLNVDALLGMSKAYQKQGDIPSAMEKLSKAFEITGDEGLLSEVERLLVESDYYFDHEIVETMTFDFSVDGISLGSDISAPKSAYRGRADYHSNLMNNDTSDTVYSMPFVGNGTEEHSEMEFGYLFAAPVGGTINFITISKDFNNNSFFCMNLFHTGDDSASLLGHFGIRDDWDAVPNGDYTIFSDENRELEVSVNNDSITGICYSEGLKTGTVLISEGIISRFRLKVAESEE